ncbi:hypothetical protein A6R68_04337 [Neotoma lepida]|uniref:Uncharacterized protein n=1 Tax=Neotoma lepida TaxID=56216 RepID=A0A1A6GLG2_NEOLE|nr:hypothetical protein A6R68_04337 [Neotoma lepida]
MSTTGDRDPTRESRDNPVTLEGEWVQEAAESARIGHESGLDGASAIPAAEVMAVRPTEVENVGPETNPEVEGDRGETVNAEEDSDIEPVDDDEENVEYQDVVDAHQFPMAGFRVMFLDVIHAILNRVYYNNHIMIRYPSENQVRETPSPPASGHSGSIPSGPIPSTVRAAEYEGQAPPEVISTFPELEEPPDFEEARDHYLPQPDHRVQEPAARPAAEESAEQAIEEMEAEATAEEPAKEVIEQTMASEGLPKEASEVTEYKELSKDKELNKMDGAFTTKFSVEPATKEKEKEELGQEDMRILITDVRAVFYLGQSLFVNSYQKQLGPGTG